MTREFRSGDRVRITGCHFDKGSSFADGTECVLIGIYANGYTYTWTDNYGYRNSFTGQLWSIKSSSGSYAYAFSEDLELIEDNNKKNNMSININLKEKFALAMTPEPQKSFRKAGITNGDDLLTDDGQKVFLSWLLKQNADTFKKEIVDDLLKEEKDESKS